MGSRACSASTNAAMPPCFCASATTCSATVVLPLDSGPKISTTRPRGKPPTPRAASKEMEPVEITEIGTIASLFPSRMMDPLPNCFSICDSARSIALFFSALSSAIHHSKRHTSAAQDSPSPICSADAPTPQVGAAVGFVTFIIVGDYRRRKREKQGNRHDRAESPKSHVIARNRKERSLTSLGIVKKDRSH